MTDLRCMLFDLDGTLVDTNQLHLEAYNIALAEMDRVVSHDFYRQRIMGFSNAEILFALFPDCDRDFEYIIEAKEAAFCALISQLQPTTGVLELIDWGKSCGLRQAVVTNAPRGNTNRMLHALGLSDRFDTIVLGSELPHGKPHPLPYLTALQRLQCDAMHAIAFEDSLSGVRSATAAGILTVGIATGLDSESLLKEGAFAVIKDFRDAMLLAILASRTNFKVCLGPSGFHDGALEP